MGLAQRSLNRNLDTYHFDSGQLARKLEAALPEAEFCLLIGSSVNGVVQGGSDLDLAFYLKNPSNLDFYSKVIAVIASILPAVECDIAILNRAEAVFRFEALKGELLFVRNLELYVTFFSLTCREYESRIISYARQQRYRLEAVNEI